MKQTFTIFGACLLGILMSACTGNNKNTQIVEEERIEQVKTQIVRFCEMSREIEILPSCKDTKPRISRLRSAAASRTFT